jgi:branched-chain amino acid transport system ATP-binding protein
MRRSWQEDSVLPLLSISGLTVRYGAIQAVRGIDLAVEAGEVVAVLGANGAGKSTTLKAVVGLVACGGEVRFDGRTLSGLPTEEIVRKGVTMVPEGRRVFPSLTVAENLALGAAAATDGKAAARNRAEVFELFPILGERREQRAGTLSGGQQQQLAIARALMSQPRLLLLDEPSLGLAPQIVDSIFELILRLKQRGQTILLVEQNVAAALDVADRGYVLANGAITMSGTASALRASEQVARAYLGVEVSAAP